MSDTTATKTESIETNASTADAADKYWEVEVTKANLQQGSDLTPFTDNTYTYLRIGTVEQNNVYSDVLALEQAAADKSNLNTAFNAVKAQLQGKAAYIDAQLAADKAALAAAIASLQATRAQLAAQKSLLEQQLAGLTPLTAEWSAKQAEIDQKADDIDYYDAKLEELTAKKNGLPASAAAMITELEQKKTAAQQDPDQQGALAAALDGAVAAAKAARRQSSTATEKDRGDDLASIIVDFYDDNRERGAKGEPQCPHSESERGDESARLHTKGGWRDHTNGNRISTTRGDKVEVVRGNYSMVVLGRQDDPGMGTKWESGGGHYARENDTLTPGAVFEIRWVKDKWSGTWKCIEETTKGEVISRFHGNVEEAWYGNRKKSIVGSELEPALSGGAARRVGQGSVEDDWISSMGGVEHKSNPEVIEKTWASSIDSQTGSAVCPVPTINEVTWAVLVTEDTHLNAHFANTTILGVEIETTQIAGAKVETTAIGGVNVGVEASAIKLDTLVSGAHLNFDFSLFTLDVFGALLKVELAFGNKYTITAVSQTEINPKADEIKALKNEITGVKATISQSRTSLHALDTKLATQAQEIATQKTQINTLFNVMSGAVMLG